MGVVGIVMSTVVGGLVLTPLVRKLACRCGAVSHPDGKRKLHARSTPVWGGIALLLALFLGIIAAGVVLPGASGVAWLGAALGLSAGMLCLLGCYDDLFDLGAREKLVGQIISTLPVVLAGCYVEEAGCYVQQLALFGCQIHLGPLGILWTIAWLVLGINALNLIDGMDGLASVIGIAISLAIAVIAGSQGLHAAMMMALVLAAALVGFLVYNLPPARIYLGDCGSMVIGLVVSWLALQVSLQAPFTPPLTVNVVVVVALLFVPLLDTALAIARRWLSGRSIMAADRGHVHHRLLDRGLGIWKTLSFLGALCLVTGAVAWMVVTSRQEMLAWGTLSIVTALLVNRQLVGHEEWALTKRFFTQTVVPSVTRMSPTSLLRRDSLRAAREDPPGGDLPAIKLFVARDQIPVADISGATAGDRRHLELEDVRELVAVGDPAGDNDLPVVQWPLEASSASDRQVA